MTSVEEQRRFVSQTSFSLRGAVCSFGLHNEAGRRGCSVSRHRHPAAFGFIVNPSGQIQQTSRGPSAFQVDLQVKLVPFPVLSRRSLA